MIIEDADELDRSLVIAVDVRAVKDGTALAHDDDRPPQPATPNSQRR
jgi:hypothetical protein